MVQCIKVTVTVTVSILVPTIWIAGIIMEVVVTVMVNVGMLVGEVVVVIEVGKPFIRVANVRMIREVDMTSNIHMVISMRSIAVVREVSMAITVFISVAVCMASVTVRIGMATWILDDPCQQPRLKPRATYLSGSVRVGG
jgi:hypothetical protein